MSSTEFETTVSGNHKISYAPPFTFSFIPADLTEALRDKLASPDDPKSPVIWSDGDSEIVVHPAELRALLRPGLVLIELPLSTDQSGKDKLVTAFSVGKTAETATLVALTESVPRGNAILASRWGYVVQEVLWQALLAIGQKRIEAMPDVANMTVSGLFTADGALAYIATRPFLATEISDYFDEINPDAPPPQPPEPLPEPDIPPEQLGCLIAIINFVLKLVGLPPYVGHQSQT
ncbi:MAG: hypothetical protein GY803_10000 [Chloroflexi bacterium]|nr:hypothetical protein [Chloroflexota bacterium]